MFLIIQEGEWLTKGLARALMTNATNVKILLERGAPIDFPNLSCGNLEIAKCVAQYAPTNLRVANQLLKVAATNCSLEDVKFAISLGATDFEEAFDKIFWIHQDATDIAMFLINERKVSEQQIDHQIGHTRNDKLVSQIVSMGFGNNLETLKRFVELGLYKSAAIIINRFPDFQETFGRSIILSEKQAYELVKIGARINSRRGRMALAKVEQEKRVVYDVLYEKNSELIHDKNVFSIIFAFLGINV